jgi:hypothetical protein
MSKLRINLPEELDKEFRAIIASKYGFSKGALSLATQDAILKWIIKNGKEPWLYIDNNMTIDINVDLLSSLLEIFSKLINSEIITLSFKSTTEEIAIITKVFEKFEIEGKNVIFKLNKSDFIQTFNQLSNILQIQVKSSLMIEFDNIYLIGGGNGCFNVCGGFHVEQFNQVVTDFLTSLNIELKIELNKLKDYQLILLNQKSNLIILTENR